ncbi:hypothetical protein [Kitasatospora sp. NPDC101183]|uniref:hypothetical protein n=1 Tax=Kitasatospora sp. NPDC101183 TaxID=3364100 RepID=UPI0037FA0427
MNLTEIRPQDVEQGTRLAFFYGPPRAPFGQGNPVDNVLTTRVVTSVEADGVYDSQRGGWRGRTRFFLRYEDGHAAWIGKDDTVFRVS